VVAKYIYVLLLIGLSVPVAAEFTIDNPLSFGEIAVTSNASVSTVSISRSGSALSTNKIYIIRPGSPGVFTLSNFPPYTIANLSVDLPAYSAMMYPNTAQFTMTAVDIPSSVNMNAAGNAQFKMGGTLSTSGDPTKNYYSGADYVIYLNLNIIY
jgi:hypothetical protein